MQCMNMNGSDKPVDFETHVFARKQTDGRFSIKKRCRHECDKINQNKPLLNQRRGGAGRKSKV